MLRLLVTSMNYLADTEATWGLWSWLVLVVSSVAGIIIALATGGK